MIEAGGAEGSGKLAVRRDVGRTPGPAGGRGTGRDGVRNGTWAARPEPKHFSGADVDHWTDLERWGPTMSDRDYYEILGLTPRADGQMVDQAYWHLVRKYQGLMATNARAQRMIDELNEAYGVLGNPRLREQYDGFRDDVLIRAGMIKPVASKPKREKPAKAEREANAPRRLKLPSIRIEHWRTYAASSTIALLAFAAAWQGVNIVLVAMLLVGGLGVSLTPTLGKHVFDIELPAIAAADLHAPKLALPKSGERQIRSLRASASDEMDAETLRESTAATIARWRRSVGLHAGAAMAAEADAVDAPHEAPASNEEPFDTVMEILRGGNKVAR